MLPLPPHNIVLSLFIYFSRIFASFCHFTGRNMIFHIKYTITYLYLMAAHFTGSLFYSLSLTVNFGSCSSLRIVSLPPNSILGNIILYFNIYPFWVNEGAGGSVCMCGCEQTWWKMEIFAYISRTLDYLFPTTIIFNVCTRNDPPTQVKANEWKWMEWGER